MGQPNPPGDIPLYEGLPADWNEFVGAFPEDKRAELAPKLKERISNYENQLTGYKQWDDLQKSGITPEFANTAISLFTTVENNPRQVYDTIGKYLGITPQEAKEAVKELEKQTDESGIDPRIQTMQQQIDTLAQIALAQRQQSSAEIQAAEQDAAVEKEMDTLKKKYGDDVDEEEILMRMLHKNMTAEQAFQEYSGKVSALRQRRPSPMLMGGSGGMVPKPAIDVTKLDSAKTKDLVAQMMQQAINQQ